jgi:uncharacterized membrane protein
MDWLAILFRIGHIVPAVFWVGGAAFFFFYVEPTLNSLGPDADKFVQELVGRRKMPVFFMVASTLTVLFGAILYWRDSNGLNGPWMTSATGIVFGVGAIAAIIAWLAGGLALAPAVQKVATVGGEMKAAGGPPSADLMARMKAAQERVRMIGGIDLVLVVFAVLCMATARYFG